MRNSTDIPERIYQSPPTLKGAFPFRVATTSYIIPADILPNIRFLGRHVDEVELVLFESAGEENLPTKKDILEMNHLARDLRLTYNVHLPTDLTIGDPDQRTREASCRTLLKFYRRTSLLGPTAYVLHFERKGADLNDVSVRRSWLERLEASLRWLIGEGMEPHRVAVENLDYPLEWVAPLIRNLGMTFCLDVGHLQKYGYDFKSVFSAFLGETSMVHLHGVDDTVDHRSLNHVPEDQWRDMLEALTNYDRGVSIEVFCLKDLTTSLQRLGEMRG